MAMEVPPVCFVVSAGNAPGLYGRKILEEERKQMF